MATIPPTEQDKRETGLKALIPPNVRRWLVPFVVLASYILSFFLLEVFIRETIRYYIFSLCLVVSSLYFTWYLGGRKTMLYVGFFNLFFAFIFSRLLFMSGSVIFAGQHYLGRTFIAMYAIAIVFILIMVQRRSPADIERVAREERILEERRKRGHLELMVASEKLKQDLVRQANLVKDELLLLQDAWRSQIHSIINDLPDVKEKELYNQIVAPFQENIINHLRDLETRLSFSPAPVSLSEMHKALSGKLAMDRKIKSSRITIEVMDKGWEGDSRRVMADMNKVWEILLNLIRNSQSAIELKQIRLLRSSPGKYRAFTPRLSVVFDLGESDALLRVVDNGGGVSEEIAAKLFREPVPSAKRSGVSYGQGTIFVKFFGESMGMTTSAAPTSTLGTQGLQVTVSMPLLPAPQLRVPRGIIPLGRRRRFSFPSASA